MSYDQAIDRPANLLIVLNNDRREAGDDCVRVIDGLNLRHSNYLSQPEKGAIVAHLKMNEIYPDVIDILDPNRTGAVKKEDTGL